MTDFGGIYRRYSPDVFRFALYLCGNEAEAQDLTAEAFLRAWVSTRPVRVGTVKAYLFMIVRNLRRDHAPREARHKGSAVSAEVPDRRPGPVATASRRDELRRVLAALQQLAEADRAVLVLCAFERMSHAAIAEALGLSVSAVKVRVHRARLKLAAAL